MFDFTKIYETVGKGLKLHLGSNDIYFFILPPQNNSSYFFALTGDVSVRQEAKKEYSITGFVAKPFSITMEEKEKQDFVFDGVSIENEFLSVQFEDKVEILINTKTQMDLGLKCNFQGKVFVENEFTRNEAKIVQNKINNQDLIVTKE